MAAEIKEFCVFLWCPLLVMGFLQPSSGKPHSEFYDWYACMCKCGPVCSQSVPAILMLRWLAHKNNNNKLSDCVWQEGFWHPQPFVMQCYQFIFAKI